MPNFRNPFLWIVILIVAVGITSRKIGYEAVDSPVSAIGYLALGIALSIAYTGYNRAGWDGVLPEFERVFDFLTGRNRH